MPSSPGICDKALQHLALVVHGPPKLMLLAIDFDEELVPMPPQMAQPHAFNPAPLVLCSEHRTEPMPPVPDRLVADVDTALMQQIFYVPK